MRQLSEDEVLMLNKALEVESFMIPMTRMTTEDIADDELKRVILSSLRASELRVAGLQQYIVDNNLLVEKKDS